MTKKTPLATLDVMFKGNGVYPEKIPLSRLSDVFRAIQRLSGGEETEDKSESDDASLRLLKVKRGSAIFQCWSESPERAISNLRLVGRMLHEEDQEEQLAHALSPLEELSKIATSLGCSIVLRSPDNRDDVLMKIESDTYNDLAGTLLIKGETTITGKVQRVGGATQVRCVMRVPFQQKLLYCQVSDMIVAREIAKCLYEDIVVSGTAKWLRTNWKIVSFNITEMHQPTQGSLTQAFKAIRKAGGFAWDEIEDPAAFLRETTGE